MKYDMHDYDSRSRANSSLLMGLMAGAAVGGGLALLFAPRQGSEMRHDLASGAQRAGRRLRDGYESMAETVRDRARRLAEQTDDLRERADDTAQSVQHTVQNTMQDSFDTASRRVPNGMGVTRATTIE